MQIGAIVTLTNDTRGYSPRVDHRSGADAGAQLLLGSATVLWDVLGKNILDRTIDRLRRYGVENVTVISENKTNSQAQSSNALFWSAWDSAVGQYLNHGVDSLLLVRVGPYAEFDVADLVRFHRGVHSELTQVYDGRGALDLVLVDAAQLRSGTGSFRSRLSALIPNRHRYRCNAYTNRLRDGMEFRSLVRDALVGRCDIQPVGKELRKGVWIGPNTKIDPSAYIEAPAYIGEGSCVGPACQILEMSTVERNCDIDAGTTVQDSCVLPGTAVGMGLSVAHSIVAGARLLHLYREVELELPDRRLIGPKSPSAGLKSQNFLRTAASRLRTKKGMEVTSTQSSPPASLSTSSRWLGRFS